MTTNLTAKEAGKQEGHMGNALSLDVSATLQRCGSITCSRCSHVLPAFLFLHLS